MSTRSRDLDAFYELTYNPGYVPSHSPDAHIEKLDVDGKPSFVLMKESTGEYYEVDEETNAIWSLTDGRRSVKEIQEEVAKMGISLTEKEVRDALLSLAEEGTLESTEPELEQKRVEAVSAFQLDIRLIRDTSKSLANLFRITRKLIRKEELIVAIGVVILGAVLFAGTFVQIFSNTSIFDLEGSALIGLLFYQLLVLSPVYAIHELSHAAACDYVGARPRELGTGLYYLAPFFYVDTSDSWRLPRRARIMISIAGPMAEMVIASFLTFLSYFIAPGFGRNLLLISAFLCFYGSLVNLSPIMETDGYYILTDLVNIPNLRDESLGYLKRVILRALGRSVQGTRQSVRLRRIFLSYALVAIGWIALFAYLTFDFLRVYGSDAYRALSGLWLTALRKQPFDAVAVGVNIAALAYFGLFLAGFGVIGVVAYRNLRMKGVKLETIHDKRVSVFLPFPSFIQRSKGSVLVERMRKQASNYTRAFSVTLEPPLCVAAIKLGKVEQSLDMMRTEMQEIERSFRSLYSEFLSRGFVLAAPARAAMAGNLLNLAGQFPPREKKRTIEAVTQFLRSQDSSFGYLLQSAFGTVWTLELVPGDYKRIRREIFPSVIADDLGGGDIPGELEQFKRHQVIGSDTIAQLALEIEAESKKVKKSPEVYQMTALLEPVKSRLVFVGRTDKVEGAVVWLGGLYLYQAWTSIMGEALEDAALGLKSLRLAQTTSLTRTQASKLRDNELELLEQDLGQFEKLARMVEDAIPKIDSTYQSALNFHETLKTLVSDEAFDVGLYKPILNANEKHLAGFKEKVELFHGEFGKVSRQIDEDATIVRERAGKSSASPAVEKNFLAGLAETFRIWVRGGGSSRNPTFDGEVRFLFAAARMVYDVVMESDIVL